MTNLVFSVAFVLATNWTGIQVTEGEVGLLQTNHVATVVYEGKTNLFTLKTDTGGAVFRKYVQPAAIWLPDRYFVVTNFNSYAFTTNLKVW